MTKHEMSEILEQYGGQPLRSLSQNFLIDENIARRIAKSTVHNPKTVVEIGPGLGALTEHLLERFERVIAFELDKTYAQVLSDRNPTLEIYHQDFLTSSELLGAIKEEYIVIANIPYHITNQLIRFCLTISQAPSEFVFLMQKEVAERIVDKHTPSILQYSVEMYAKAEYLFTVPKSCFYPAPNVDSAVVRFTRKPQPMTENPEDVIQFLKSPFGKRRKMLLSTLKKEYKDVDWDNIFSELAIDAKLRPENLSLDLWILLYNEYIKHISDS